MGGSSQPQLPHSQLILQFFVFSTYQNQLYDGHSPPSKMYLLPQKKSLGILVDSVDGDVVDRKEIQMQSSKKGNGFILQYSLAGIRMPEIVHNKYLHAMCVLLVVH